MAQAAAVVSASEEEQELCAVAEAEYLCGRPPWNPRLPPTAYGPVPLPRSEQPDLVSYTEEPSLCLCRYAAEQG